MRHECKWEAEKANWLTPPALQSTGGVGASEMETRDLWKQVGAIYYRCLSASILQSGRFAATSEHAGQRSVLLRA